MAVPLTLSEVPNETPYVQYQATMGQTSFPYPFPITQDADLVVIVNGVTQPVDSTYSLTGQGNDTGGNVIFNSGQSAGAIITLYRDIAIERISQIAQNSGFSSTVFNAEFNNIYLIMQQLESSIAQCLQIPNTNIGGPVTTLTPANYANKYLAFDANGNPTPAALTTSGTVTAQLVGGLIYPQTTAESNAGVTPVNYTYVPGAVDRYQTNATPGTTDMTSGFQSAINQARYGGAEITWGYTGNYVLATGALDCTFPSTTGQSSSANQSGLVFRQIAHPSSDNPAGIYVNHNAYAVFDLTGTSNYTFHDASIYTSSSAGHYPKTCWLTARNSVGGSIYPNFYNTKFNGYASVAVLYNYSAETGVYVGNRWYNNATDAGACVVVITASNYFKGSSAFLSSSYTTIYSGSISCTQHQFYGGDYVLVNPSTTSDLFYFEAAAKVKIFGGWGTSSGSSAGGRSAFYLDNTNGGCARMHMSGFQMDDSTYYPSYGMYISGTHAVTDVELNGCYLPHATNYIATANSEVLQNLTIINPSFGTTNGGANIYELVNSFMFTGAMNLTVSNSENSFYVGDGSNWTISPIGGGSDTLIDTTNGGLTTYGTIITHNSGALKAAGGLGLYGNSAAAQSTGWGTPVGAAVVSSYNITDAGGSNSNTNKALAEVITVLKSVGILAT